jgi:hypothetical protein
LALRPMKLIEFTEHYLREDYALITESH